MPYRSGDHRDHRLANNPQGRVTRNNPRNAQGQPGTRSLGSRNSTQHATRRSTDSHAGSSPHTRNPQSSRRRNASSSYEVAIEGVSGPADYGHNGRAAGARSASGSSRIKGKILGIAIIALLLALIIWIVSMVMPHDRIADGIHVGEVDVSGMTVPEASAAVSETYAPRLEATTVYVFADEETANSADVELKLIENEAQAEQLSFEEAQRNKKLWVASAESLDAWLPADELAQEALDLGNGMGLIDRVFASSEDLAITPRASFDDELLGTLIEDIDSSLGSPVVDYDLDIEGEDISLVEGNDGYLLDEGQFESQLSDILLVDESSLQGFVADIHQTHYVIDEAMAQSAKDAIEARIPESVEFVSEDKTASIDRATLMDWVSTKASEVDGEWYLEPYLDPDIASADILKAVNIRGLGDDINVTFEVLDDESVIVHSNEDVSLPDIDGALRTLDETLFGSYRSSKSPEADAQEITIDVSMNAGKSQFSLDEALSYGLVTEIESFTTQFSNTASTANRTENIHLVSDAIDKSVVSADGGQWSFLEHAGSMEAEDGYKEAGVIVAGKMDQDIGGGVCQVATTVFNAAYQAGFGIKERHNHSLYSSSYPAGLDAAIASPALDLIWTNPTSSEVLLLTSYTDYSVTVTLIGIDPEYEVTTERGDWKDGKEHTTEYEIDEDLRPDASYIKTTPTDGMEIGVSRYVKDKDGNQIDYDMFYSIYAPINRVIAYGKGSDLSAIKAKYAEDDDD